MYIGAVQFVNGNRTSSNHANKVTGGLVMRDEERISLYYDFGTMDWRSEMAQGNKKTGKTSGIYSGVRLLKLANLLISLIIRNLSTAKRK